MVTQAADSKYMWAMWPEERGTVDCDLSPMSAKEMCSVPTLNGEVEVPVGTAIEVGGVDLLYADEGGFQASSDRVGDGDPHSVIHPTLVRPLTPTDILESMLARDDGELRPLRWQAKRVAGPAFWRGSSRRGDGSWMPRARAAGCGCRAARRCPR